VSDDAGVGEDPRATMDAKNPRLPEPGDDDSSMDSPRTLDPDPQDRTLPARGLGFVVGLRISLPRHEIQRGG
jgi:hypothetical protein